MTIERTKSEFNFWDRHNFKRFQVALWKAADSPRAVRYFARLYNWADHQEPHLVDVYFGLWNSHVHAYLNQGN